MTASDAHKQAWGTAGKAAPVAQQANRAGRPWQRKDGRWCARAYPPGGPPKVVYGTTLEEVTIKQHQASEPVPRIRSDESIGRPEDIGRLVAKAGKSTRITLDLDQATYTALNQWLGSAAAEVGAPVSKAQALRAMIRAVGLDKSIGLVVIDLLRRDQT